MGRRMTSEARRFVADLERRKADWAAKTGHPPNVVRMHRTTRILLVDTLRRTGLPVTFEGGLRLCGLLVIDDQSVPGREIRLDIQENASENHQHD